MKKVFTTGEVAKICKVSQQSIIRAFDAGQIKGFRVPGSRFRRIPRAALFEFMRANNLPTDDLDQYKTTGLIIGKRAAAYSDLRVALKDDFSIYVSEDAELLDNLIRNKGAEFVVIDSDVHLKVIRNQLIKVSSDLGPLVNGVQVFYTVNSLGKESDVLPRELGNFVVHGPITLDELIPILKSQSNNPESDELEEPHEITLLVDPGDAPPELLGELLTNLARLYRSFGGSGLRIVEDEIGICIGEEVPAS